MKFNDLKIKLFELGVNPRAYDFKSTFKDEVYCLENTEDGWVVYYRERGLSRDVKYFSLEDAACQYFYDLVLSDPTVFK